MERSPQQVYCELLVMRCQSGERDAFTKLVELWQTRLLGQAMQLCEDRQLALDVLQDSWLAIARGLHALQDPASFPSWSYRIVRNKAADAIRFRMRERRQLSGDEPTDQLSRAGSGSTELDELRLAIRGLPPDSRELLRLYYFDGLTIADISRILEIPAGTVKSRLSAARKKLRELMQGADND